MIQINNLKACLICKKIKPERNKKFCSCRCNMIYRNKVNPNLRYAGRTKNHFKITKECKNYIDGLLLSDGSIPKGKLDWSYRFNQRFARKYKEWAIQIHKQFNKFKIKNTISNGKTYDKRTNKIYFWTHLQTLHYPEFNSFRQRWYINNQKEVPKNIEINPVILKNWFLGDGSARNINKNGADLKLATDKFSQQSLNLLIKKLQQRGYNFHQSQNRLLLYKKDTIIKFQKEIYFPNCFKYKKVKE